MVNPILVALDVPTGDEAMRLARLLEPHVGGFKVGLELLMGSGPTTVARVAELGKPVFCDAKLHDIPNTVERAARQVGALGARWLTVHAAGGDAMLRAAVSGLSESSESAGILAVTVLTSLDDQALHDTGVIDDASGQVKRLAGLAAQAGVEGVVCSVAELTTVASVADHLVKLTPGIRPAGSDAGDQARIATPAAAIAAGADLLVVGRPITRAVDPVAAAVSIASGLG